MEFVMPKIDNARWPTFMLFDKATRAGPFVSSDQVPDYWTEMSDDMEGVIDEENEMREMQRKRPDKVEVQKD